MTAEPESESCLTNTQICRVAGIRLKVIAATPAFSTRPYCIFSPKAMLDALERFRVK